jgi:hypothetical protein
MSIAKVGLGFVLGLALYARTRQGFVAVFLYCLFDLFPQPPEFWGLFADLYWGAVLSVTLYSLRFAYGTNGLGALRVLRTRLNGRARRAATKLIRDRDPKSYESAMSRKSDYVKDLEMEGLNTGDCDFENWEDIISSLNMENRNQYKNQWMYGAQTMRPSMRADRVVRDFRNSLHTDDLGQTVGIAFEDDSILNYMMEVNEDPIPAPIAPVAAVRPPLMAFVRERARIPQPPVEFGRIASVLVTILVPCWYALAGFMPLYVVMFIIHCLAVCGVWTWRWRGAISQRVLPACRQGAAEVPRILGAAANAVGQAVIHPVRDWAIGCAYWVRDLVLAYGNRELRALKYLKDQPVTTVLWVNSAKISERAEIRKNKSFAFNPSKIYPVLSPLLTTQSHTTLQLLLLLLSVVGIVLDVERYEEALNDFLVTTFKPVEVHAGFQFLARGRADALAVCVKSDARNIVDAVVHLLFAIKHDGLERVRTRIQTFHMGDWLKGANAVDEAQAEQLRLEMAGMNRDVLGGEVALNGMGQARGLGFVVHNETEKPQEVSVPEATPEVTEKVETVGDRLKAVIARYAAFLKRIANMPSATRAHFEKVFADKYRKEATVVTEEWKDVLKKEVIDHADGTDNKFTNTALANMLELPTPDMPELIDSPDYVTVLGGYTVALEMAEGSVEERLEVLEGASDAFRRGVEYLLNHSEQVSTVEPEVDKPPSQPLAVREDTTLQEPQEENPKLWARAKKYITDLMKNKGVRKALVEDHKGGDPPTPDWMAGLKKYHEVTEFYRKNLRSKWNGEEWNDEADFSVYEGVIQDLDDEIFELEGKYRSSMLGLGDFGQEDYNKLEKLSLALDQIMDRYEGRARNHAADTVTFPLRFRNLVFDKIKNAKKRDERIKEWDEWKKDKNLTSARAKFFEKMIDERIWEKKKVPRVEEIPENHAIVVDGVTSETIDLSHLKDVYTYTVAFTYKNKTRFTRGTRAKDAREQPMVQGVVTCAHLIPDEAWNKRDFTVSDFVITCNGKEWKGNPSNTQILHYGEKASDNVNIRVKGGDAIMIVDNRINEGKAVAIRPATIGAQASFFVRKDETSFFSQGLLETFRDVTVSPTIAFVSASTDKNEGSSGTPIFQFQNGALAFVAINKGVDKSRPTHTMVQLLHPLNACVLQGSTGTGANTGSVKLPSQPGQKE